MANITKNSKGRKHPKSKEIEFLENLHLQNLKAKYPSVPYPPKKKYSDRTTNGLQTCIIDFIRLSGFQAERINSTGRKIDNTRTVTDCIGRKRMIGSSKWIKGSGQKGTADISATIKGRSIKIEVKCEATNDRIQSKDQIEYQKEIETAGGIYIITKSFSQFYAWYNQFNPNTRSYGSY